tara:strand:+ start:435 stop:1133 length:699 start_codon:yes stop_codon:yes gene_type:complete
MLRAELALLEVNAHLFTDEEVKYYQSESWPGESHLVPNRIEGAWKALKDAVVDTELVAYLHSNKEDTHLLRRVTEEVVDKITRMLNGCNPLASKLHLPKEYDAPKMDGRYDPRVLRWKRQLKKWKDSILCTSLGDDSERQRRLEASVKVVEELVEERRRMQPLVPEHATDSLAREERTLRGDLANADAATRKRVQQRQTKRADTAVNGWTKSVELAKRQSAGLNAIKRETSS